jgi:acyl carrier protein
MDIFEEVKKIIVEEINCAPEKVTPEASLKDDLGADSIDAVQIVMDLEDKFSISIDEDDATKILTVKDIVDYVTDLVKNK